MKLKSLQNDDKLRGGYYTPSKITEFMTDWLNYNDNVNRILEPSAGDGQFVKKIVENKKKYEVTCVEIVPEEAEKIKQIRSSKSKIRVINEDFYKYYEEFKNSNTNKFDAVIGNPPYIRYQYLTSEQREFQSDILKSNGLKPNKLINAWVAFTIASLELIREGGKFAFVLPTDILQVTYAKQLRSYLLNKLSNITIVTFNELVFEGIQQDVVLILGTKSSFLQLDNLDTGLKIVNIDNVKSLKQEILDKPFTTIKMYNIDKWTRFYLDDIERNYYDKYFTKKMINFNSIAKTEVGITTGNNKFFVISDSIKQKYNLCNYVIPILGRSIEIFGNTYNHSDLEKNIKAEKKTWLLNFNNKELNSHARAYIDLGEKSNENLGYKLNLRDNWYEVPSIWVPDAFILRRIGKIPRFVLNNNNSTSTDTFHRVKFVDSYYKNLISIFFYSSATLLSLELEGRVFGGGALEILPGDMKNLLFPKITKELSLEKLSELNQKLDDKIRNGENWDQVIKWVDKLVIEHSEFDEIEMEKNYNMWKKINNKRLRTLTN
ncbi:class I SAM-dependent methyltransferase [Staphylococcus xylosus]|uniref:class I SAM-dependent methyltransferase n=1 Tax=Staphylococcus xylosus TaxID=1288 RepID=UPI002DBAE7D5|nr:class I SAM-dependent methyltransferase [Staphylococcus xylosus]MEB7660080.1 class I SAM-dependent methyltransferase [Staphylococcus xylosus]MEB7709968.1 class I SAM-dependent methyltransferase [Staphylococcus xylosus]MEB7785719.1 class I SAM-dependent methyltransferase [Staphylococcus xylosus]